MRDDALHVDPLLCNGCTQCQQVCADCNAGIDVPLVLELLAQVRYDEAVDVVLRSNPLPAVSARVCPHPCDHAVNALGWPQADVRARRFPELLARFGNDAGNDISIRAVELWIGDYAIAHHATLTLPELRAGTVAVVGAGPAGLSAAWQLRRRGWRVTVLDAGEQPGGMLRYGIPEFRLPRSIVDAEVARLRAAGIDFKCRARVGTDVSFEQLRAEYDAVVIAVGDARARALRIAGDDAAPRNILTGLEFLRRFNAGETLALGARVAVVGGGNTAVDCARAALRLGAEAVIVYRRTEHEMPAIAEEVEEARREGVTFHFERVPTRLIAQDGRLVAVAAAAACNEGGRVTALAGTEATEPFDNIILAVGEEADLAFLNGSCISTNGHIKASFAGATARPGVFACGDVAFGYGTVTQSIASGRKTAEVVSQYLEGKPAKR